MRSPRARRILTVAVAVAVAVVLAGLIAAPETLAAAGGGSAGFTHGGGFGGGGHGGGGRGLGLYILIRVLIDIALLGHGLGALVLLGLALLYAFFRFGMPNLEAWIAARRQRGAAHQRDTRKRQRRVELAAAEAADEDPIFDPDTVRTAAASLFTQIELAWDAGDRIRLRGLVAPALLAEWERRLDDFDRRGWRNRIELLEEPAVEYVGLKRSGSDKEPDTVTVRVEARMRDYVTDGAGRRITRRGQFGERVRLREFWTLERRADHWILASIEQGAEGAHALSAEIVPTAWSNTQALADEAVVEQAAADVMPAGVSASELVSVGFEADARATALDLSLVDGRFAPEVLEVAARRAVDAWSQAIDGADDSLRALADAPAVKELLHPGDPSGRTRLVIRGAKLQRLEIVKLDPASEPPAMTVDVTVSGRRYIEDRDTTKVLSGDPARTTSFTERWTLALTADPQQPWRITAVRAAAVAK